MFLRIAVLGEIGSGNLGDDLGFVLLRDELLECLREFGVESHVDYFTPARFSDLDYTSHDAVITGCGTLLDAAGGEYVRCLVRMLSRGKIVSYLGTGLSDPWHRRPTEEGRELLDHLFAGATQGWVRGQDGPDFLWLNGLIPYAPERNLVGINMGYAAFTCVNIDQIWWKLRSLVWDLRTAGEKVVLVSCWPNDNVWYRRDFPEEPVLQIDCGREPLAQLGRLKALISFRGHLGVLASCAGATAFPIVFSRKVEDMYASTHVKTVPLRPWEDDWAFVVARALAEGRLENMRVVELLRLQVKAKIRAFADRLRGSRK